MAQFQMNKLLPKILGASTTLGDVGDVESKWVTLCASIDETAEQKSCKDFDICMLGAMPPLIGRLR